MIVLSFTTLCGFLLCIFDFVSVRLVNGPTIYEGRVEVYHNGVWGTVCDDGWTMVDAQVVCRELGFDVFNVRYNGYYGQGSGVIWLDDVNCVGNESTIENCTHSGWGIHDCDHSEDAGVKCSSEGSHVFLTFRKLWTIDI